jgi:hypothetical protein
MNHRSLFLTLVIILVAFLSAGYWYWHEKSSDSTVPNRTIETEEDKWLYVKEWGIDVRKPVGMPDLQYALQDLYDDEHTSSIGFSNERLVSAERAEITDTIFYCTPEAGPGGYLTRTTDSRGWQASDAWWSDDAVQLGEYYYLFFSSQATCSDNPSTQAIQSELKRSLNLQGVSLRGNIRLHAE